MYITIVGVDYFQGVDVFKVNQHLTLKKDRHNMVDEEAIGVYLPTEVQAGFVANSIYTVAKGTHSAGYIHHKFHKEAKAIVRFIIKNYVIAEVLFNDEEEIDEEEYQ